MLNIKSTAGRKAIWKGLDYSRSEMRPHLDKRNGLIKRYQGSGYGSVNDQNQPTLLPTISMTANAYMMSLVANNPRFHFTTHVRENRAFARKFTEAVNATVKEIRFADELRLATLDAWFLAGFMKIYLAADKEIEIPDPGRPPEPGMFDSEEKWEEYTRLQHSTIKIDPGKIMIERISPDDFTFDMNATKWDACRYMCHEYDVPVSVLKEDDRIDQKQLKQVQLWNRWRGSLFRGGGDRADTQTANSGQPSDLEPMTRIAEVYLPFERQWAMLGPSGLLLYCGEYEGPERGPFRMLTFADVPDAILGLAPGMDLRHLHDIQNSLLRKQVRQAKRQKEVIGYIGDPAEAEKHKKEPDGGYMNVTTPDGLVPLNTGGPNQMNLAFAQVLGGIAEDVAGNPSAMAGRGPTAKTATQEQLVHQRMAGREEKMRERIVDMVQGLGEDLALMLWVDEHKTIPGEYALPGVEEPIRADWTPEDRQGEFDQFQLNTAIYSMQYKSPQQEAQELVETIQTLVMPSLPLIQQQGGTLDMQSVLSELSRLRDQPVLTEVIKFNGPMAPPQGAGGPGGPANPNTGPRRYIRESVSGGNPQDSERTQTMQAALSAASSQQN